MPQKRLELQPYSPAHLCPQCGAEGAPPNYHGQTVLAVFGSAPPWPCSGPGMDGKVGAHICSKCQVCGFSWMEAVAPGMDSAGPE